MNQSEIMTLRSQKVKPEVIRVAIMAGKLSGILASADRDIERAEHFGNNADWSELLRIMEGTLDKLPKGHRAETPDGKPEHKDRTRREY